MSEAGWGPGWDEGNQDLPPPVPSSHQNQGLWG